MSLEAGNDYGERFLFSCISHSIIQKKRILFSVINLPKMHKRRKSKDANKGS